MCNGQHGRQISAPLPTALNKERTLVLLFDKESPFDFLISASAGVCVLTNAGGHELVKGTVRMHELCLRERLLRNLPVKIVRLRIKCHFDKGRSLLV